jgi:hypothetical protein
MVSKNDIIELLNKVTKVLNEQPEKELEEFLKVLLPALKSVTPVLNKLQHVQSKVIALQENDMGLLVDVLKSQRVMCATPHCLQGVSDADLCCRCTNKNNAYKTMVTLHKIVNEKKDSKWYSEFCKLRHHLFRYRLSTNEIKFVIYDSVNVNTRSDDPWWTCKIRMFPCAIFTPHKDWVFDQSKKLVDVDDNQLNLLPNQFFERCTPTGVTIQNEIIFSVDGHKLRFEKR